MINFYPILSIITNICLNLLIFNRPFDLYVNQILMNEVDSEWLYILYPQYASTSSVGFNQATATNDKWF